jgi:hypothetical protein
MHARLKRFVSVRACLRQAIAAHLHAGGRPISCYPSTSTPRDGRDEEHVHVHSRPEQAAESRLRQAIAIAKDIAEVESGNIIAWRPSTPMS